MAKEDINEMKEQKESVAQEEQEIKSEQETTTEAEANTDQEEATEETQETSEETARASKGEELEEVKNKYLRLYSDFENFRRRTAKERLDLVASANEGLVVALLPILDDFERAQKALGEDSKEKEGFELIYNKFKKTLEQKGVKEMEDCIGKALDTELHDAITQIPAPSEELKGKIVDVIEKGYYLNDKVVRFAKVVVGA
ncbi:nucleotide exchange factor GrpE [Rapidithrix thailandica]|uniref:Protein GrpE n=1 Tax=Rapidithrix thailandica TaxID=413964 RepID=A0AAW9SCL0_9BACT